MNRTLFICSVLLVGALAASPLISAQDAAPGNPDPSAVGISYEQAGPDGILTVVGGAGRVLDAWHLDGHQVISMPLDQNVFSMPVPTGPTMADGSALLVQIGDVPAMLSAGDPDWNWD